MATPIGRTPQTFLVTRYRAGAGDPDAQYRLGNWYTYGQGVVQDEAEGVRWFRLAADQGHASAQGYLGVAYAYGRGVEQDDSEAARWYRLAADQGLAGTQVNLGSMDADRRPRAVSRTLERLRRLVRRIF